LRDEHSLPDRSAYPHWIRERIRWSDTDMLGHVNNLAIAAYCESGRTEFLRSLLAPAAGPRSLLLLAHLSTSFLGELHWPGEVEVGTGVLEIGRSSCRMGQAVFAGKRCVSRSESVLVLIDEATRRPRAIDDALLRILGNFPVATPPATASDDAS
jgi:acyl-CoA thioester hydrolase